MHYARIDNGDWLIIAAHLTPPAGESIGSLALDYDVIITPVITHNALLTLRHDFRRGFVEDNAKPIELLGYQLTHINIDVSGGSWWRGFTAVFSLGMKHIAAGIDHMLFLLVLLLPTPLFTAADRWQRGQGARASAVKIIKTVSGFTVGHSITLALGVFGVVQISSRPVEVLIALSILVSAWYAARPAFAGKEAYVAAGFGLIHGLAFAGSLAGLGYDPVVLASSVFGFNLGIEAMQLAIAAAVLPWLVLLNFTPLYTPMRWGAAAFAALAALGWIGERAFSLTNPMNAVVERIAAHAVAYVAAIALLSIAAAARLRGKHVRNVANLSRDEWRLN